MNFTNTDRAKIQVYGQFKNWQARWQVCGQLYWQVFYQIYPIQTKIEQEMKK